MKQYTLFLVILLFCLPLGGCMGEDSSLCLSDDGNVILKLSYTGSSGEEVLGETITSVEMVLFRDEYRYYDRLTIKPEDISEEGTIRFELPEGIYYVVFWGNQQTKTRLRDFNAFTTINDAGIYHVGEDTGDPVYYAPYRTATGQQGYDMYTLEVPSQGIVEREFMFMNAHRTINVFIDGINNTKATDLPAISLDNLHNGYNFHLVPQSTTKSFTQESETRQTPDGVLPGASFLVSHFDLDNPITIGIQGTSGDASLSGIVFSQFLREFGYTPVIGDGAVINIIVTISEEGMISIRIPPWDPAEVKPSY